MDDNQITGATLEGIGHAQDAWGGATGDLKIQARGKLNEIRGGAQRLYGDAREQLGERLDEVLEEITESLRARVALITRNPFLSLGVAAGLGMAIGLLSRASPEPKVVYIRR